MRARAILTSFAIIGLLILVISLANAYANSIGFRIHAWLRLLGRGNRHSRRHLCPNAAPIGMYRQSKFERKSKRSAWSGRDI